MRLLNAFLLLVSIILACGCEKKVNANSKKDAEKENPMETFVDGVTGRSSVKAGQKAKKEIERISNQERKELDEVLEK